MKDALFSRERSILSTTKSQKRTFVVHYTTKPESFDDTFVVRDNDFGGLCVYLLDDVIRGGSSSSGSGLRALSEAVWPGRTSLLIEVASDDVLLLQYAPLDKELDEYVIRAGAKARVIKEIA